MIQVLEHEGGVVQFVMARRLLGRRLYRTSCYWIDGLLVDSGMAHASAALLGRLGRRPVRCVVNTHAHEDHIGSNRALQERREVPILAHPLGLPLIARPELLRLRPYQRFLFGTPRGSRAGAIGERVAGEGVELRVVPTPGHSPDHVALLEPRRGWLFSGDAYIGGRDRILRDDADVWEMIRSCERLLELPLRLVFTGTGAVIRDPQARLAEKVEHLRGLARRVWELHDAGVGEAEIGRRLLGPDLLARVLTSDHFSARNLVRSFLARRAG